MTTPARHSDSRSRTIVWAILLMVGCLTAAATGFAQELGGAGTIQGLVKDPQGGAMQSVEVKISNPVSGFSRTTTTDATGRYVFRNLPPNRYHVSAAAQGFQRYETDVEVRTSVPIDVDLALALEGATATVNVVGHAGDLIERDPTAHTDIDEGLIKTLPVEAGGGLNHIVMLASPGVVADANGFFHPIGDHAQTQFSIDNQPVTDQQSRIYSNQISDQAVQSLEIITGVAPAEFGDKSSLVVRVVTKSGLDRKPSGDVSFGMGSFKTPTGDINFGAGNQSAGNFLSFTGQRTDRFLDPPEFKALHDHGDSQSFFDRLDVHSAKNGTFHLNVYVGRSSFDVPNTIDQDDAGQDQHQKIDSYNIAPGYTKIIGSSLLLAANGYVRRDKVTYSPSADPFADQPGTTSQDRRLRNIGGKLDLSLSHGPNNIKFGGTVSATKLNEDFFLGLTDPTVNSPCLTPAGDPSDDTGLRSPTQCTGGLVANPDFVDGLVPSDLTRGGAQFHFVGDDTINEQAFYVQDEIKSGNVTAKFGVRFDHYDGLTSKSLFQPRVGISYLVPRSNTVLRASYGLTQETPYNENLILASSADAAVFGTGGSPLAPGTRNQVEVGVQQSFGNWLVADVGYFYKHTTNGYDFGVLFDTPIFFPVAWDHSKIDGITARLNLVEHNGFSAFTVMGHTSAIFSPPGTGGILLEQPEGDFRIDHDQRFQQTTNVQYVFSKKVGAWGALSWRYDSGLVAGAVPDYATALTLTGDQQAAIGLFCGPTVATIDAPLTDCSSADRGAKRLRIPADGTADDVANPPRIAPRHLFDLGFGVDNLFNRTRAKVRVRASIINVADKEALYNFLSTFSGTHFVTPRAFQVLAGVTF
jgi:Carboxypeptidase regulatory-like domain